MAEVIEIKVSSHPKMMRVVRGISEQVGNIAGLSSEDIIHLQIAIDEASTNIIRHGYHGDFNKNIKVTFHLLNDRLEITLQDSAKPFQPQSHKDFEPSSLTCGGLGVTLIKRAVDEINYSVSKSGGNRLTLVKYLIKKDKNCEDHAKENK